MGEPIILELTKPPQANSQELLSSLNIDAHDLRVRLERTSCSQTEPTISDAIAKLRTYESDYAGLKPSDDYRPFTVHVNEIAERIIKILNWPEVVLNVGNEAISTGLANTASKTRNRLEENAQGSWSVTRQ